MATKSRFVESLKKPSQWIIFIFLVLLIGAEALAPTGGGMPKSYGLGSRAMVQTRGIYLLLNAYADAHNGVYPTGNSSTEIFQKLVDENHFVASGKSFNEAYREAGYNCEDMHDTTLFYFDMPGKTLAKSTTLKPENVCFDVTVPMNGQPPDGLPIIFTTGYKVIYAAGNAAIPIAKLDLPGWAGVTYAGGNSWSIWSDHSWGPERPLYFLPDHSINAFVPAGFNSKGITYQQLTPSGPAPP